MLNFKLKILFLLFTIILHSCNNDSSGIHANTPGDITYVSSISTTDIFDQPTSIYTEGETIRIRLSISSNATQDTLLKFETYKLYDLYIENELGVEVWRQSDITTYKQEPNELALRVGRKLIFQEDVG